MTTLHVDVWTTANQLAVQLQSTAGANGNKGAIVPFVAADGVINSNRWVGLDIPLSEFKKINPDLDLSKLDQILWLDNGALPGPGVQRGDFYIDNVYFFNSTPVIQSPSQGVAGFSCKVASLAGVNYVLQGTPSLAPASWSGVQTNAGTGGLLTFTVPASGQPQRFFRIRAE